jgi:hypothetical protein
MSPVQRNVVTKLGSEVAPADAIQVALRRPRMLSQRPSSLLGPRFGSTAAALPPAIQAVGRLAYTKHCGQLFLQRSCHASDSWRQCSPCCGTFTNPSIIGTKRSAPRAQGTVGPGNSQQHDLQPLSSRFGFSHSTRCWHSAKADSLGTYGSVRSQQFWTGSEHLVHREGERECLAVATGFAECGSRLTRKCFNSADESSFSAIRSRMNSPDLGVDLRERS